MASDVDAENRVGGVFHTFDGGPPALPRPDIEKIFVSGLVDCGSVGR
jgi:hypothetical protein